ncbi:hypothetical protein IE077_002104, partial [Cardiosporidium cionae]
MNENHRDFRQLVLSMGQSTKEKVNATEITSTKPKVEENGDKSPGAPTLSVSIVKTENLESTGPSYFQIECDQVVHTTPLSEGFSSDVNYEFSFSRYTPHSWIRFSIWHKRNWFGLQRMQREDRCGSEAYYNVNQLGSNKNEEVWLDLISNSILNSRIKAIIKIKGKMATNSKAGKKARAQLSHGVSTRQSPLKGSESEAIGLEKTLKRRPGNSDRKIKTALLHTEKLLDINGENNTTVKENCLNKSMKGQNTLDLVETMRLNYSFANKAQALPIMLANSPCGENFNSAPAFGGNASRGNFAREPKNTFASVSAMIDPFSASVAPPVKSTVDVIDPFSASVAPPLKSTVDVIDPFFDISSASVAPPVKSTVDVIDPFS